MFNYKIWLPLIIGLLLVSCSTSPSYQDISSSVKYKTLAFPPAVYGSLVWFKNYSLVAFLDYVVGESQVASSGDYERNHNPYAIENDLHIHDFQFELADDCTNYKFYDPMSLLPDGRLGMLIECGRGDASARLYMAAYDWDTTAFKRILDYDLPNPLRSGCFSWNPKMTQAIQGTNDGTTGSLYWLTLKGAEPLQLILKDGNKSWDISKSYAGNGNSSEGWASCADWSPDGEHILFFASLEAIGIGGFARMDARSNLYSYAVDTGKAEVLLSNLYHAGNIRWSPDGKLVAFQADLQSNDDNTNILIFRPSDKKLFLIATGRVHDMAWSPDSKDIAVIWCAKIGCSTSEIRKYFFELPVLK